MSNSIETSFLYRNSPRFRSNSDDEVGAGGKLWGLVLFCGCAAACIALSLVLGSYDYSDPGFSRFNTKLQVSNLFGVQGAWTADLFYLLFGWGAWVFVIGLFYFLVRGLKRLRGKKVSVSPIPMGFRIWLSVCWSSAAVRCSSFGFILILKGFPARRAERSEVRSDPSSSIG